MTPNTKRCAGCNRDFRLHFFSVDRTSPDGLGDLCRWCRASRPWVYLESVGKRQEDPQP